MFSGRTDVAGKLARHPPREWRSLGLGRGAKSLGGRRARRKEVRMAQFSVNASRFDPYKNFKFRVRWDGRYVAGISKVGR